VTLVVPPEEKVPLFVKSVPDVPERFNVWVLSANVVPAPTVILSAVVVPPNVFVPAPPEVFRFPYVLPRIVWVLFKE
jgi:hypothetical protein